MRVAEPRGRGRLSTIDLLPDEAEPDIAWAAEQLRERSMPQVAILTEFNKRLADRGIAGISRSAWNRHAIRKAVQFRQLDQVRTIAGELSGALGTDGADEVTITIAEMLKVAIYEQLEAGKISSKGLMELSRTLNSAVAAQRSSEEYRRRLAQKVDEKLVDMADVAEGIGREAGMSAATLAKMRRYFLGVRSPEKAPE